MKFSLFLICVNPIIISRSAIAILRPGIAFARHATSGYFGQDSGQNKKPPVLLGANGRIITRAERTAGNGGPHFALRQRSHHIANHTSQQALMHARPRERGSKAKREVERTQLRSVALRPRLSPGLPLSARLKYITPSRK
jgi:hypothetical protein